MPLIEEEDSIVELKVTNALFRALFSTNAIDEVEQLIPRFREAARAESLREGRHCYFEFRSIYYSALFYEVHSLFTHPVQETPPH